MTATLKFIGHIRTPYLNRDECPGQARAENGTCQIVIDREFLPAMKGLESGKLIQVLYWFDQSNRNVVETIPGWSENNESRGVFSIRSPDRPNPIALSTVEVFAIEDNVLTVTALDCINNTVLLDIKPYIDALRS